MAAPRNMLRSLGLCVGIVLVVLGPAEASATSAGSRLQQARRVFEAGRYPQAAAEFRRIASERAGTTEAVIAAYYVGLAEERQGNRDAALGAYRGLLTTHGENTEMSGFARQRIRELESGAPGRAAGSSAAPGPAASPAAPSTTGAVDRLAQSVLAELEDARPSRTSASSRRPPRRPSAARTHVRTASEPAHWPTVAGTAADAEFPLAGAIGSVAPAERALLRYPMPSEEHELPMVSSVDWANAAATPADRSGSAPSAGRMPSSPPPRVPPPPEAAEGALGTVITVRRAQPTVEVVSSYSGTSSVEAMRRGGDATPTDLGRREVSALGRGVGRVPPPAVGTLMAPLPVFSWPQGDPEGLPALSFERPRFAPIEVPSAVPSLIPRGSRASDLESVERPSESEQRPQASSASTAPGEEAVDSPRERLVEEKPEPVELPISRATEADRNAALNLPWTGPPAPLQAIGGNVLELGSRPVPPTIPSPVPGSSPSPSSFSHAELDGGSGTLEEISLPSSPVAPERIGGLSPASASLGGLGRDDAGLTTTSTSGWDEGGIALPVSGSPGGVSASSDQGVVPVAPLRYEPSGVPGQTVPALGPGAPWIEKALALKRLGQLEEAIAAYREALAVETGNPVIRNNLADILVEQGRDLDEAVALVTEALNGEIPDRGPYFSTLGWAHARRGDLESAERYLDEAVRVRATASRLYRRGRVYAMLGQSSRARADFDRALVYAEDASTSALVRQALAEMESTAATPSPAVP